MNSRAAGAIQLTPSPRHQLKPPTFTLDFSSLSPVTSRSLRVSGGHRTDVSSFQSLISASPPLSCPLRAASGVGRSPAGRRRVRSRPAPPPHYAPQMVTVQPASRRRRGSGRLKLWSATCVVWCDRNGDVPGAASPHIHDAWLVVARIPTGHSQESSPNKAPSRRVGTAMKSGRSSAPSLQHDFQFNADLIRPVASRGGPA